MFYLIGGLILAVICIIAAIATGHQAWYIGIGFALVGIVASSVTTVPAQNVGVVTSFGKPTGRNLGPGLHGKVPWDRVHDMDGTIQSIDNLGASADEEKKIKGRTTVRLNTNSLMFVENALRWKIKPEKADTLFRDWRKGGGDIVGERIGPGLVEKELAAALNVALAPYDPYAPGKPGQTTDDLVAKVVERLNSRIGDRVEIVTFTILRVDLDDATQARIINLQEEVQRTKQAEQRKQTAAAEADANKELAASVSKDPNVLVSKCLDVQRSMVEKGQSLAGVPSCWPVNGAQLVTQAR